MSHLSFRFKIQRIVPEFVLCTVRCCTVNDEEQKGISLSDRDDDTPT